MKAAVFVKTTSGKSLQIIEIEKPIPKAKEIVVRTRAASVNPLDWRVKGPRPGVDIAGEVVQTGPLVTQFRPGDAVFGICKGAFAEYACAPETEFISKPDELSFEQAACMPVAGLTALQGLRDRGALRPGQKVLINGAAGGVGTFAVQFAKSMGAEVTGVCSTGNIAMVRSLGADIVIDYTQEDFTRTGCRYDLILDNVGNRTFSDFRRVMNSRSRCVLAGAPKQMSAALARVLKALLWPPFLPQRFTFFIAKMKKADLSALCEFVRTAGVTPVIDKRYPFARTADAIAYVEKGHARAKVIVSFGHENNETEEEANAT